MKYEQIITQFQQQAPARIAQLGRLAAVSIESRPEAERQLKIIKTVLRALAVEGSLRSKVLIISAARDRAGVGLDYPTLAQVNCTSCQPIGNVSGISLPVSDLDVQTQVPGMGTDTLRQRLIELYNQVAASAFTPISTTNGRNFDFPNTSGKVHNYNTLDEFVRAVIFRYQAVSATLTHNQNSVLKAGSLIPALTLQLTHTQGGNPVAVKRITDTSGNNNNVLVEQSGAQISNPTSIQLLNVGLGSQYDVRPGGRLSREFTGYVQDQVIEGLGGTSVQPKAYVDFVLPSYLFKTSTDITALTPTNRGTVIRNEGEEIIAPQGTHTTVNASFDNEFLGYAFPASYGNLTFIGQQADGYTANLLNIGAFRSGTHFNATITYTGDDGLTYSAPYFFIFSAERLTSPNNFRFTHPAVQLPGNTGGTPPPSNGVETMSAEAIRDALLSLLPGPILPAEAISGLPAGTSGVSQVNGQTGVVSLVSDNISDVGQAQKFVTQAEKSKIQLIKTDLGSGFVLCGDGQYRELGSFNPPPANSAPSIALGGANPYTMTEGDSYAEPGYTATDPEDGNVTANVQVSNNINNQVAGTYYVTYQVADSDGATTQVQRTVIVQQSADTTPPSPPQGISISNITTSGYTAAANPSIDN